MSVPCTHTRREPRLLVSLVQWWRGENGDEPDSRSSRRGSKMLAQFGKAAHDQQLLRWCGGVYLFMFENPSIAVRHEYSVQSRGQRGIDVRLGTVADHPGGL